MRELAIGDIHGCSRAFHTLLDLIKPERSDTIVLLGDYIDRGPDSCDVIDTILKLNQVCTVVALAGNHEKMLLEARAQHPKFFEWLSYGGSATLESYQRRGLTGEMGGIPPAHWKFLTEQTLDYWESEQSIFVHASLDPALELSEQSEAVLFWERLKVPTVHKSGKEIICGHTSQKSGLPAVFDKGVCIDTWVYGRGFLTCFDTIQRTFIQTNEAGKNRTFTWDMLTK